MGALVPNRPEHAKLYIVDNDSQDGSYEAFTRAYEGRRDIELIASSRNDGYGAGNNIVLRRLVASDEFETVLLLNPDTELRTPIPETVFELLAGDRIAAVGARLEDPDTTVQVSAFNFPGATSEFLQAANLALFDRFLGRFRVAQPPPEEITRRDWLAGAAVFFKLDALREVGLFDEEFFLYFEEVDLFRRLAAYGWQSWYLPEMRLVHHVGASTQISDHRRREVEMPDYWYASRSRYFTKEWGRVGALWPDLCWLLGRSIHLLSRRLSGKSDRGSVTARNVIVHSSLLRPLLGRKASSEEMASIE